MDAVGNQVAPGDLRVSDADRDRAVTELSEHFQAGRITHEEFDERSGLALQAKTAGQLTGLFSDLPATQAGPVATPGLVAVPAVSGSRPSITVARIIATAAGIAALAIVVSVLVRTGLGHIGGPHRTFGVPVPLLVVLFIVVRIVAGRRSRRRGAAPDAPDQDR
jgi:hypothetical protein